MRSNNGAEYVNHKFSKIVS